MANRKKRLADTDPFAPPGNAGGGAPSLADLTASLIDPTAGNERVQELEARIAELEATAEDAIIVRQDGLSQHYKRFELRDTELVIPQDIGVDEWIEIGVLLMRMKSTLQWLLGDWLVYGIDQGWEDGYKYIQERFGYEVESLWSYASICRNVPTLTRVKALSFSHHRAVTKFAENPELQSSWLQQAIDNDWSAKELLRQIQLAERGVEKQLTSPSQHKSIARLARDLAPEKWLKLTKEEKQEILGQLRSFLQQLEEMS